MGKTRCYFLAVTWDAMKIGTLSAAPAMATNNRASQKLRFIDYPPSLLVGHDQSHHAINVSTPTPTHG